MVEKRVTSPLLVSPLSTDHWTECHLSAVHSPTLLGKSIPYLGICRLLGTEPWTPYDNKMSYAQEPSSIEKIAEVDTHIGVAMSGLTADARTLIEHARVETQVGLPCCVPVLRLPYELPEHSQSHPMQHLRR